jgi:hypothetical protein
MREDRMSHINKLWARWKVGVISSTAGVILGCIYRLFIDFKFLNSGLNSSGWIMTIAFLFFVPLAMGYLTVNRHLHAANTEGFAWYEWFFLPWVAVLLTMFVSILVKWEGFICLIFAGPIMLFSSLLGGIAARLAWGKLKDRSPGMLSAFALPLLLLIVETHIPSPYEIRTINTEILIHAPASTVWDNIKSVRAIQSSELPGSWVSRIGFPSPVAATLSHEGVGGIRQASFTGGLVFFETVNRWDPQQDLRFSIHANTESIPRSTLDEHVTIGGEFFDVLNGEYRLEQRPNGIVLHLSSRERLSTHLNPYAGEWTDAVMIAIQKQILAVIRNRCETGSATVR